MSERASYELRELKEKSFDIGDIGDIGAFAHSFPLTPKAFADYSKMFCSPCRTQPTHL